MAFSSKREMSAFEIQTRDPYGPEGILQEFLGGDVPLGPWTPIPELIQNEVTNTV